MYLGVFGGTGLKIGFLRKFKGFMLLEFEQGEVYTFFSPQNLLTPIFSSDEFFRPTGF